MERTEILTKLNVIINTKTRQDEVITEENNFADLGFDSLDSVEMVMDCEKEFSIAIPEAETTKMQTVKDLIDIIEKLI